MTIRDPGPEVKPDLSFGHSLVDLGVPVFHARLTSDGAPHRAGWEKVRPSHGEVDGWRRGQALCAHTGVKFDVLDVDPRHGGADSYRELRRRLGDDPEIYAKVRTRSGGLHLYVPPLGLGTKHPVPGYPGIDLQGRGAMVFIPPTVRLGGRYELKGSILDELDGAVRQDRLAQLLATPTADVADPDGAGRHSTTELWARVLSAPEGAQRDALLKWVDELEKRYEREDAIAMMMALRPRIPVYDRSKPWKESDLMGLLHAPGEIIPDGRGIGFDDPEDEELPRGVRIALGRMRDTYLARQEFESWRSRQPGTGTFSVVEWSLVEDVPVTMGAEGVFPETGRIWVAGPPGAGKSALGYWTLLMRIRSDGQPRAVYEAEMGRVRVKRLLRSLGATDDEMSLIRYYYADGSGDLVANGRALVNRMMSDGCSSVLYDAAAPLLRASGMDEEKTGDVLSWVGACVDPIASAGGFVYIIDHTGWSDDSRVRGASGKPAAGDLIVTLHPVDAFRRGVSGSFRLEVMKDRDGYLTGQSINVTVECASDGTFDIAPDVWIGVDDLADAQMLSAKPEQVKIMEFIMGQGHACSVGVVAEGCNISREAARSALRRGATGKGALFSHVKGGLYNVVGRARSGKRSG